MVLKETHHQVHGPEMAPVSLLIFFLTICWLSCAPGDDGDEAGGEMVAHRFISTRAWYCGGCRLMHTFTVRMPDIPKPTAFQLENFIDKQ